MGASPESGRRPLERVREALDKVRKVLRDLDHGAAEPAVSRDADAGGAAWGDTARDDTLRAHEAARLLDMPVQELYAAIRDQRLPARRLGRFLWLRRSDVEAFANQLRNGGPRPTTGTGAHAGQRRGPQR